ncbi:uncharacterized protein [Amphiura filiformis]|uniref:uncharacterized protein isoform X2 n=1 Tax=Amphiura filiformis TaxID=82378 RepID=UPI003B217F80
MAEYAGQIVVFKTEAEVNEAIRVYEEETVTHFVTSTVMKSFSNSEMKVNRFRWYVNARNDDGVSIPYDRIPFCFVGKKAMTCHMGEDRGKATKAKYQAQKAKAEAEGLRKYRKRAPVPTKKSTCTAKISIKKIVKFPEYQLEEGKEQNYDQRQNNKRLLAALNHDSEEVMKQIQYYVKFPCIQDHKDHPMGEEAAKKEPIDKRVHDKMQQLADAGVSSYIALQKLVFAYVEKELFKDKPLPPRTRRRYFPVVKDIQNFLTKHKSTTWGPDKETVSVEGQIPLMDWEDDGADNAQVVNDNHQEHIVSVTFQPQQPVSTRSEHESFLTLLNTTTGMAGTMQQEVVATSTMHAPPQTIVPTTPQMIPVTTQMASTSMIPDGSQIMTTTEPTTQIVFTSQELVPTPQELVQVSHELDQSSQEIIPADATIETTTTQNKTQRKVQRIGLVCKMKALTRELLDYSLLVKDMSLLQGYITDLESMVANANSHATLDPLGVQKELARNRRKRSGGPVVFDSLGSKKVRLSDIL